MNFQMFKLYLEKTEEPEIKLPKPTGSLKRQESSRKTSTSTLLTISKPLTVWITTIVENSSRDENTSLLRNLYAGQEATIRINNLRYADDTMLTAESEELNSLLMKVKQKSEKVGLKLGIQKTKIMAFGPSQQIDG